MLESSISTRLLWSSGKALYQSLSILGVSRLSHPQKNDRKEGPKKQRALNIQTRSFSSSGILDMCLKAQVDQKHNACQKNLNIHNLAELCAASNHNEFGKIQVDPNDPAPSFPLVDSYI